MKDIRFLACVVALLGLGIASQVVAQPRAMQRVSPHETISTIIQGDYMSGLIDHRVRPAVFQSSPGRRDPQDLGRAGALWPGLADRGG